MLDCTKKLFCICSHQSHAFQKSPFFSNKMPYYENVQMQSNFKLVRKFSVHEGKSMSHEHLLQPFFIQ